MVGLLLALSLALPAAAEPGPTTRPAAARTPASQPAGNKVPTDDLPNLSIEEDALKDIELLNLQVPTVVTAGRHEQRITSVPYAISVITRDDIRNAGSRTIADALRLVPGVDIAEMDYANFGVSARGFHGFTARTLVLIDGRQTTDALLGGTLWGIWPVQIEDIDRIEVIRGPGVTWGPNAANGVINIITRDPGEQQGLTTYTRAGSRGSWEQYAGYGIKVDKLRLRVSGGYESSDGFNKGGSFLKHLDDDYRSPEMSLSGVYDAGPKDKISFSGGSRVVEGGIPTSLVDEQKPINPGTQASFMAAGWEHRISTDNAFELRGYVNDVAIMYGRTLGYRYQQLGLQFNHTFKPAENHTLTWGIDAREDLLDGTNYPEMFSKTYVSNPTVGLYVQDEWRFAPRWALNVGGRIDYDSYGGFNPSGRIALSYDLTENSSVYGSVAEAYRLYPAAGRFLDLPQLGGLIHTVANPDFKATPQIVYELGYRGRFFDKLDIAAAGFWHETTDELTFAPRLGPPGLINLYLDNHGAASLYGFECEAKCKVTEQLTLLGNYTFQKSDWRGPEFTSGTDSIVPPVNKFMLGARYSPLKNLHLSSTAYYVDHTRSPDPCNPLMPANVGSYLRLDLRAQYDICKDKAYIAVGVRNLLDPQHFEGGTVFLNSAEVPRMVYAEVHIRLDK